MPSSVVTNACSAWTRASRRTRSSSPPSANTASIRSWRTPASRLLDLEAVGEEVETSPGTATSIDQSQIGLTASARLRLLRDALKRSVINSAGRTTPCQSDCEQRRTALWRRSECPAMAARRASRRRVESMQDRPAQHDEAQRDPCEPVGISSMRKELQQAYPAYPPATPPPSPARSGRHPPARPACSDRGSLRRLAGPRPARRRNSRPSGPEARGTRRPCR